VMFQSERQVAECSPRDIHDARAADMARDRAQVASAIGERCSRHVGQVRTAFRQLLTTPIMCTPFVEDGRRGIRFEGRIGLAGVLGGDLVTKLVSSTGFERLWIVDRSGVIAA
jgi:hypothetical protein